MTSPTQQAAPTIQDYIDSLTWALGIIKSAPSAADLCPWHGKTPFPHSCQAYTNPNWVKALSLVTVPALSGIWVWNTQTLPPIAGQVRTNTGAWNTATSLMIYGADNGGTSAIAALAQVQAGDTFKLQHNTDATRWATLQAQSAGIPASGYYTFPVQYKSGAGTLPNSSTQVAVSVA